NGPVFPPKQRVGRFLPGLGAPQADLAPVQELPEPFDADGGHNALLDQVGTQLGQRPLIHADKDLGRRQRHLADLLAEVGRKLPRGVADLPVRVPGNALDAVGVEAMDDDSDPLRRTIGLLGNGATAQAAAGQQDDARVQAVDGVAVLTLHAKQLLLLMRAKGAYDDLVHVEPPRGAEVTIPPRGDSYADRSPAAA